MNMRIGAIVGVVVLASCGLGGCIDNLNSAVEALTNAGTKSIENDINAAQADAQATANANIQAWMAAKQSTAGQTCTGVGVPLPECQCAQLDSFGNCTQWTQ